MQQPHLLYSVEGPPGGGYRHFSVLDNCKGITGSWRFWRLEFTFAEKDFTEKSSRFSSRAESKKIRFCYRHGHGQPWPTLKKTPDHQKLTVKRWFTFEPKKWLAFEFTPGLSCCKSGERPCTHVARAPMHSAHAQHPCSTHAAPIIFMWHTIGKEFRIFWAKACACLQQLAHQSSYKVITKKPMAIFVVCVFFPTS
jgi:hypothetical protein